MNLSRAEAANRRAAWIVLLLWTAIVVYVLQHRWPGDLAALYFAGHFWAQGQPELIYAGPVRFFGEDYAPQWSAARDAMGHAGEYVYPYVYPPVWAALLAPASAHLTARAFFFWSDLAMVALVALCVPLAWRFYGRPTGLLAWTLASLPLVTLSMAGAQAALLGQPQILVGFLTILAMERLAAGRSLQSGVALGLAATFKLSPVFLLLLYVPGRHWRAAAAALAVAAGIALLSLAVAGVPLHREFLERLGIISGQVVLTEINYSVKTLLYWLADPSGASSEKVTGGIWLAPSPVWLNPVLGLLLALGAALLLAWHRRRDPLLQLRLILVPVLVLVALTGPLSWVHYFLTPLLLAPGLLALWPPRLAWPLLAAFGLLASVPAHFLANGDNRIDGAIVPYGVAVYAALALAFLLAPAGRQNGRTTLPE